MCCAGPKNPAADLWKYCGGTGHGQSLSGRGTDRGDKARIQNSYDFISNPHKIFTREEILNGIWDMAGNFVNDNTLTVTMKRLREKLGDKEGNVIVTVRGIGYRLNL